MYIDKELIFNNLKFDNQGELFDFATEILEKKDYVYSTFNKAIKEREKKFPTGIEIGDTNVALCHTDSEHIIENKIMILRLDKPVKFKDMATLEDIDVKIVFILLLNNPSLHLEILQKISRILQDSEYIEQLEQAKSQEELYNLLSKNIKNS